MIRVEGQTMWVRVVHECFTWDENPSDNIVGDVANKVEFTVDIPA